MRHNAITNIGETWPRPFRWLARKLLPGYDFTTTGDDLSHAHRSWLMHWRGGAAFAVRRPGVRQANGTHFVLFLTPSDSLWMLGWGPPWKWKIRLSDDGEGCDRTYIFGWVGAWRLTSGEIRELMIDGRARAAMMVLEAVKHEGMFEIEWKNET